MLTATASPFSSSHSSVRSLLFVLRGVVISLGLFGLLRLEWVEVHAVLPVTLAEAALAVRLFGVPVLPVDVTLACSGVDAISLSLGAILAFPASWRHRVWGLAGVLGLIVAVNVLRIGSLGRAVGSRGTFDALHLYVWPAVVTLAIAAYVLIWMRYAHPPRVAVATGAAPPPRISRRFLITAAVFLLTFVSAAPLYLHSSAVLTVGALIARSAAAMLTAAGVYAVATGNVLLTTRGGFLVTEECISTPLIPIYLAAVAAYAPNWKRMLLGVAAAAPLFLALGVARLLLVALPQSVEAQTFFIHAFYQLMAGVALVVAAAYWRHRDRTAIAYGVSGLVVAILFMAIAGAGYLRLITAIVSVPGVDPQGAIALLPAFQTALYLALWTAAGLDAGWRRFAVGLAALVLAQVAGLVVLNAILAHTDMTMAVRDVRGWALAAPVIACAAMVSFGRPRR